MAILGIFFALLVFAILVCVMALRVLACGLVVLCLLALVGC